MADFEALNLTISAESSSASGSINSLVQSLQALQGALSSINTSQITQSLQGLSRLVNGITTATSSFSSNSGFANGIVQGISNITSAVDAISDDTIERVERLSGALSTLSTVGGNIPRIEIPVSNIGGGGGGRNGPTSFLSTYAGAFTDTAKSFGQKAGTMLKVAGKGAAESMRGLAGAMQELYKGFGLGHLSSVQFLKDLGRIAKYRILRSMIKAFTSGVVTGLQNLAHYSAEANAALSQLSTGSLYLKNSLGAALYPAIASLIGVFNSLIGVVVRALNVINMLFSVLGGKGTYIRATKQTKDFTKATGAAGGAAKALKQELMGFDEINALSPNGGGGGGGGGGALDYSGMFEEAPIEEWMKRMVDTGDFSPLGRRIAAKINRALAGIKWADIRKGAKSVANAISSAINGFISVINPRLVGNSIAGVINTAATFVSEFWSNTNWEQLGEKVKKALTTALDGIDSDTLGKAIVGKFRSMIRFLNGWLRSEGGSFFGKLGTKIGETINSALSELDAVDTAEAIVGILSGAAEGAANLVSTINFDTLATKVNTFLATAISNIPFGSIRDTLVSVINNAVKYFSLPETLSNIKNITQACANFIISAIKKINWEDVGAALAGIANALVDGVSSALSEGKSSKQKGMIVSAIEGFFKTIDINAVVNLAGLALDSSFGRVIAFTALAKSLLRLLPTGITATVGTGLLLSIPGIIDIAAEIGKLTQAKESGDSIKQSVAALVGKGLFGAAGAFVGWVAGGPTGAALGFSIGVKVFTALEIGHVASSEGFFSDDITEQIQQAAAAAAASAEPINTLAGALTELTGITIPSSFILENLDTYFAGSFLQDGSVDIDGLTTSMYALLGSIQTASQNGDLDTLMQQLGLTGSTAESAAKTVADAASTISGSGSGITDALDGIPEAAEQVKTAVNNTALAVSSFATNAEQMPEVIMIDGSSLDNVKKSATEASKAVGGLSTFLAMIQRAFNKFTGTFDPLSSSANSANASVGELRDTIKSIPATKSITLTTPNADKAKKSISNIKSTLNGISDKTINIKVKAGLTSGAKSFLNTLKNVSSGSTQASIGNLLKFSQFAQGGFPKSGELFMANENGRQELVGRIGNQPAVANQDQIGEAIFRYMDAHSAQSNDVNSDDLASAVVRGLKAAGVGAVYLDGKQLSSSINRETQRSGKPAIQF